VLGALKAKRAVEIDSVENAHNIYTRIFVCVGRALKAERVVEIYSVENLCGSTGIRGEEKTKI
jgi:hypothetical protein